MSKKKNKSQLPTAEKLNEIGFKDGYAGLKSKENELIARFCKRGIKKEQIRLNILSYCLGYKRGQLISENGLNNCKLIKGEVAVNGKIVKLDENKTYRIDEKILELTTAKKKKGRK